MLGCDSGEAMLYTGKGIYVGVLDSGVSAHPDLRGRIAAFKDFTMDKRKYYDDNGHGTHDSGLKNSIIRQRTSIKALHLKANLL